jgi:hypothetical protein
VRMTLLSPHRDHKYMYMHECIDLSEFIRVRVAKWLLNLAADPLDAATAHILAPNTHKRQQHLPLWMSVLAGF